MQLNIIHLTHREDRLLLLREELKNQEIVNFKIWDGVLDPYIPTKGISKAHKQIVQFASNNNLSEILIAEDDLKFTDKGAFDFFITQKPKDFDLYLASIYFGTINDANIVEEFSGLTFYIISQKFYSIFLNTPEHDNLDRLLKRKGKFVVCNPFTVVQHNGHSDNAKMYCNYNDFLKNRKVFKRSKD